MIEELRPWYLDHLDGIVLALRQAIAFHEEGSSEGIASLRRIAHNLRGSGATFGFPELSEAAGKVEDAAATAVAGQAKDLVATIEGIVARDRPDADAAAHCRRRDALAGDEGGSGAIDILVVDDDEAIQRLLRPRLEGARRRVHGVGSVAGMRTFLAGCIPALVVLDLLLPDADGRSALVRLRSESATLDVPVIVLSTHDSDAIRLECLVLGADAYFAKPADLDSLAATANALLRRVGRERGVSRHDPLTGLPNRRAFCDAFGQARALAERQQEPLSLAVIDFDWFKSLNDRYGHLVGDRVLAEGSRAIRENLRRSDHLARWGGEEFVVLMPRTDVHGAAVAMANVLAAVRALELEGGGERFTVTASAGVAAVAAGADLSQAIDRADYNLYRAKASGRDRVVHEGMPTDRIPAPKVLVFERRDVERARLAEVVAQEGLQVVVAGGAAEAEREAAGSDIVMAILGVFRADERGLAVLQRLRSLPGWRRRPVVVVAATDASDGITRAFDLGADDYLREPWTEVELAARVRRLLDRAG